MDLPILLGIVLQSGQFKTIIAPVDTILAGLNDNLVF